MASYAVMKQGGHQYRIASGDVVQVEKLEVEPGEEITLEDILLVRDGESLDIGDPRVQGAAIKAKVLRQRKGPKIRVYKFKRRKGYEKRYGHRQPFTELKILSIMKDGKEIA
jgi:large subunit ribosomal protein L21